MQTPVAMLLFAVVAAAAGRTAPRRRGAPGMVPRLAARPPAATAADLPACPRRRPSAGCARGGNGE